MQVFLIQGLSYVSGTPRSVLVELEIMEKSNVLGGSNGSVAQVKVQHGIVEDHVIEDTQTPGKLGTLQRGL